MKQELPPNKVQLDARAAPGERGSPVPVPIPDHELLHCIGRGSYGVVWLARSKLGVFRAVKVVHRQSFGDSQPFDRELTGIRKFEPISRSHPGFVPVLHVGMNEEAGYFYYVMELGDDHDLGQNIQPAQYAAKTLGNEISRRGKLALDRCLELALALSQALVELHKNGLVHRDVKPSNIIFIKDIPKLADIGLVTRIDEANSYVGTEGFIPREGPGTPQADIFSLGKTLYEAMTGRDRQDFPELPTQWDKSPEHEKLLELNEVILGACQQDVSKRYQSALDMHSDLLLIANGKFKRLKVLERRFSFLKRVAKVSGMLLVIIAVIGYPIWRERKIALDSRERQAGASVAYGTPAMESGDLSGALPHFASALQLDGARGDRSREKAHRLRLGSILSQCAKFVQFWAGPKKVKAVWFSPNGQQVLIIEHFGQAQVFDVETGRPASPQFGQTYGLWRGAFSPDGNLVVTASEDKTARIWKVSDGTEVLSIKHAKKVLSACFSPDGSRILTSCEDGNARVWDTTTSEIKLLLTLKEHTDIVTYAAFSRDGHRIVTTSQDHTARVWDATDGSRIGEPLVHENWVEYAAFSPDGKTLVTASDDHKVSVWETETGRKILPDLEHSDNVASAEYSPDGRLIVTAGLDPIVHLWLAESHRPLSPNSMLRHSDRVMHASVAPDGHRIVSACVDGTVRIWDLANRAVAPQPLPNSFSGDKTRFLTASRGGIQVRDAVSKEVVSSFVLETNGYQATLSGDGRFVLRLSDPLRITDLKSSSYRKLEVWDVQNGQRFGTPLLLTNILAPVSLSMNGRRLVAYINGSAQTWDVVTGLPLGDPVLHEGSVKGVAFSPGGDVVASWSRGVVKVWNATNGHDVVPPINHPFRVTCVEFSPDASHLVTYGPGEGFAKTYAQVWDVRSGKPVGAQLRHADGVVCAAFSPDGGRVVTGGEDSMAIIWDAATGRQVTPALRHENVVKMANFSPDGRWVVTVSGDKAVRIWNAQTGDLLTPPLQHLVKPAEARFVGDGSEVVTSDLENHAWIWNLPSDQKPVGDVIMLANLLAGGMVTSSVDLRPSTSEPPDRVWQRLRNLYPSEFTTSPQEIAAWHEIDAQRSEVEGRWFGAAFHLERLLALRPNDPSLTERLTRVRNHLKDL